MTTDQEKFKTSAEHLENGAGIHRTTTTISSAAGRSKKSIDEALDYLRHHADILGEQGIDLRRLRRKIDWRIIPLMYFMMGLQHLDKHQFKYAIIMGLPEDLGLEEGNKLNNVASCLYWAYLTTSPFVGLALGKVPVGKFLGICMTLWGIVNACLAAVQTYPQVMVIRLLMGIFDAAIPPSLMLLSAQYYRKDEQAIRYAWWFSSIGMGDILGGFISYGFQFVHNDTFQGWRIMYLVLGVISTIAGICAFLFMPDTPMKAKFLTDAEKTAILHHVASNKTGIASRHWEFSQIKEFVSDPQIWLLALNVTIVSCGSGITGTYGAKLIKGFGFSSKEAALLSTPTGVVGIFAILFGAYCIRKHWLQRWAISTIGYTLAFVGAAMLAWAPKDNKGANLTGIYMIAFSLATVAIKYQWVAANVAGHTKRGLSAAMLSGSFSLGQIIAPYAVQQKDAPDYKTGKDVLVATKITAIFVIIFLALYYLWENKRRDRLYGPAPDLAQADLTHRMDGSDDDEATADDDSETWANVTDRQRKNFRYVY